MSVRILVGDCLESLRTLPDASVQCCVTSPPYWGLRDYGHDGQLGLEATPEEYVARMVEVFREVRRVLRDDGTLFLNIGDSYVGSANSGAHGKQDTLHHASGLPTKGGEGLKPKDLVGIPWRLAFALQADGWWLRSDIIWAKPNPMPESVRDRPTKSHEYVFMLSKSARYFWDQEAVRENGVFPAHTRDRSKNFKGMGETGGMNRSKDGPPVIVFDGTRNVRTVWTIATQPFPGSHFAVMPPALAERCILAGCPVGGTVLDPFGGAGTTGLVAQRLQRDAILCELSSEYAAMAEERIRTDAPLFADVEVVA